jgi:ribosome biogenesis GTPase / thiamine phosphate phosphatase
MIKARVMKLISNRYSVLIDNKIEIAKPMGKLRLKESPIVGDWVMVEQLGEHWVIQKVEPRTNMLIRPVIANVDQALIVTSLFRPDFSAVLLDRLLFLVFAAKIEPVICITKCDLVQDDDPVFDIIQEYIDAGYKVVKTGFGYDMEPVREVFRDKITVLTGQSGAGKSALLNRLDATFKIKTQETSKALNRGKHTTRHVELHPVASGWVADTPGFSSLSFKHMSKEYLAEVIHDFKPFFGKCRFRNCIHINEPDCAIKEAVKNKQISSIRYENYVDVCELIDKGE